MRTRTRINLYVTSFKGHYRVARKKGLYETCGLIRTEARQKMRVSPNPAPPGSPPNARNRGGLREINFHVQGDSGIIGPRKFANSNFFNRPVPNIHEVGGVALSRTKRGYWLYPERSFMYSAVKRLQSRGLLSRTFSYTLRRSW